MRRTENKVSRQRSILLHTPERPRVCAARFVSRGCAARLRFFCHLATGNFFFCKTWNPKKRDQKSWRKRDAWYHASHFRELIFGGKNACPSITPQRGAFAAKSCNFLKKTTFFLLLAATPAAARASLKNAPKRRFFGGPGPRLGCSWFQPCGRFFFARFRIFLLKKWCQKGPLFKTLWFSQ